ncbi:MAG: hypothetical protein IIB56_07400, partial [Planctomycetes bacterium]|nr:hypothetical protein [Planctomycetota bacterium]
MHGTPFSFDGNSFCGYIVLIMTDYKRTFEVLILLLVSSLGFAAEQPALQPIVEVEEEVYRYSPANNGAGPMWCRGSTCLVRIGEDVFASGIETLEDFKP